MLPWLGWPFVWLAVVIAAVTLAELASCLRSRRWNWWFSVLVGITALYQLQLVAIACLGMADEAVLLKLVVSLGSLSSVTTAAILAGMGARRIWIERVVVQPPLSWFRAVSMGAVLCLLAWNVSFALRVWTALQPIG